jgi:TetR/AcrR family transcriptional repressor for divergent bdcA
VDVNVNKRARGRPREFALDAAIQVGQDLFHEHGYENVSIATLTDAIGITAPSFYTAFGSKGAFFKETLQHYSATVVPLDQYLNPGKSPRTALGDMLKAAACAYAAHPQRRGCLILEHAKGGAAEWGIAAAQIASENRDRVLAYLKTCDIAAPAGVVDYVATVMLGLSAAAREGWGENRLIAVAQNAAAGLDQVMSAQG